MKLYKLVLLFFLIYYNFSFGQENNDIEKIKKKISIAKEDRDLARNYYKLGYTYNKQKQLDSAYRYILLSKNLHIKLKDTLEVAKRLYSLGKIEYKKELYFKSDSTLVEALKLLKEKKNELKITTSIYNLLGINANLTNKYKQAIEWYNKALLLAKDSVNKYRYLNNIANNFISLEKYNKAKDILFKIKTSSYFDSLNLDLRWKVIDNFNYAKLENGETVEEEEFLRIAEAKKEKNEIASLFTSYSYLSYCNKKNKNLKRAQYYANLMYKLSFDYDRPNDRVFAIDQILSLQPGSYFKKLSEERMFLSDSINNAKQKKRNEFVTNVYNYDEANRKKLIAEANYAKEKTKHLEQKSQKQQWIFTAIALLLTSITYIYYRRQKTKKEKIIEVYKTETRLAKKIHDELANDVYLAMNKLQNSEAVQSSELLVDLDKIYKQTRDISHENSPVVTGEKFQEFLQQLFIDFSTDECKIMNKGLSEIQVNMLTKEKQIVVYRVLQELLVNMKKHSQANLVVIAFEQEKDKIKVRYKDNGLGTELIASKNGLKNMETRMQSIGGTITFDSEKQKGFQAKFQFKK
ncbi:tetratricopeptide repeat-containing sensor histidine kinase [Tenacibaculum agarivorans]|uniref:tetratricopeptide repeat-containing sensor histidine kinase n=1 Tax=Tenacibaculum agarivorans TaxID=1908389 RepID=UPI000A9EEE11|nr:tetratricopeptide repeat-containing sensor histidine kinase [Tenacibaculum agarivorans]